MFAKKTKSAAAEHAGAMPMPAVPTLEEALPDLGKVRAALEIATESLGLKAEIQ